MIYFIRIWIIKSMQQNNIPFENTKGPPLWPSRQDYGRSWVKSKNRVFSNFFVVAITSSKTSTKLLRTENPWILHFREKIFRRGRPLRGSRSHRKAPQAEIFLKTNKGEAKKQKKKAGLHYIGRPSFFAFLLHLQSRISWKPMNTTFDSASNARQTRVKRAANAHHVVLKFSAPNIGGDLSRSEILNTWY